MIDQNISIKDQDEQAVAELVEDIVPLSWRRKAYLYVVGLGGAAGIDISVFTPAAAQHIEWALQAVVVGGYVATASAIVAGILARANATTTTAK